jgi:putative molybdopterin biosynthesis protein
MKQVEAVASFDRIKVLSDPRRMEILRLLMASSATLTQLARSLKHSPAWVRHHILALESAGLIAVSEIRKTGRVTEKFYQARAGAFLLQEILLPRSRQPTVVVSGSHDLALEAVADRLAKHINLLNFPVGSLDGLVNLRQGLCQVCGTHLRDQSGEYNAPTVRHLFPDREVSIVTLAHRIQGLILSAGNPKGIRGLADLENPKLRFVNRNPGSGTRLWIDHELGRLKIDPARIRGYDRVVRTHSKAAAWISQNKADAAIGLQAAAHQYELDFISLFEERYDLVLPRERDKNLTPLLDYIQTPDFRAALRALTGYNTTHSGEQIQL